MNITLFPDAEKVVCTYLAQALAARPEPYTDDVLVDVRVPDLRRDRMVIVNSDGGVPLGLALRTARVRLRTFTESDWEAGQLALMVEALMPGIVGVDVNDVEGIGAPSYLADPSGQAGRLQWVQLVLAGTVKE